jgi:uncharacterized membrane protein
MNVTKALKTSFIAGLVLITPLVITIYILRLVYNFVLQFIDPVVQQTNMAQYTANVELVAQFVSAVLILVAVTLIGYIAQRESGRRLFGSAGRIVTVIPLVRTIYSSVRQMATSIGGSETSYERLVLVEFPRRDVYTIGLVTGESPRAVQDVAGGMVYNVFLPSSPNPASGRLVLVPEEDVHDVDLGVRQGMRLLMTTGMGSEDEQYPMPLIDDLPEEASAIDQRAVGTRGSGTAAEPTDPDDQSRE